MRSQSSTAIKLESEPDETPDLIKLDIACGSNLEEGWTGIDLAGDAGIIHDLFVFPWPIADGTVSEARCSHFAEHIPHYIVGHERDVWWEFWDEVYRIMVPGGTVDIIHPYAHSSRAVWDPTHVRFIHEMTWQYLDAEWRKAQKLDHYPVACDFEVVVVSGAPSEDIALRSVETQMFARQHYLNAVLDLKVTLRARK